MSDTSLRRGDRISIAGIFRDGTMDERRSRETAGVQYWRVDSRGGGLLSPVLPSGAPDVESYWFGRATGIVNDRGRYGVVSKPTLAGQS